MAQAPHSPAKLHLHLLGGARIVVDGADVDERLWTRRKSKTLVKILALSPHHQLHREQLLELLWPEADPELASNNLHKVIHAARRALEPDLRAGAESKFLLTHDQQVSLRAPGELWIDAEEFAARAQQALGKPEIAACEAALALYAGELLEEDRYEDWAAGRREQLRLLAEKLIAALAREYEAAGDLQRSLEQHRRLLAFDPLNEEAHRNLMRLYTVSGSRHQALQQYQTCRELLRRELDAEPETSTTRLYEQITSGQLESQPVDSAPPPPGRAETPPIAPGRSRRGWVSLAGVAILLAGLAAWGLYRRNGDDQTIDSIAVLPFTLSSTDQNVESLSDGISESIINSLSQISALRVTARTTAFRYKGSNVDPLTAGQQMKVEAIVTGRLLRQGETLEIQADLIHVETGAQLWGNRYNRSLNELPMLQSEIAREISERLRAQLSTEEQLRVAKVHTTNAEALQAYARGRYFWNKRKVADIQRAVDEFNVAIRLDPGYALAYAGLADCYHTLSNLQLPPTEAIPLAREAANRALALDDRVAGAHASLAVGIWRYDWNWAGAEREFRRAIEIDPNYASAHQWYGQYLTYQRKFAAGLAELRRAQQLDPLSPIISANLGLPLYFDRNYDGAITQFQQAFEFQKDFPFGHFFIGWALEMKGQHPAAVAAFQKAVEIDPTPSAWAYLGHGHALAGNRPAAQEILLKLQNLSRQRYVSPYYLAVVCAGLRENGLALGYLSKALEDHSDPMVLLGVEPKFDGLRNDPKFQEILQRIGLPR
ncbi:MAG: BTAD domain-containing putative transcriptional regulator [Blastocatellia bacterium]|nr:BTAD domain-containing putative transcriptional regulator [Blastocatellia bacterium]